MCPDSFHITSITCYDTPLQYPSARNKSHPCYIPFTPSLPSPSSPPLSSSPRFHLAGTRSRHHPLRPSITIHSLEVAACRLLTHHFLVVISLVLDFAPKMSLKMSALRRLRASESRLNAHRTAGTTTVMDTATIFFLEVSVNDIEKYGFDVIRRSWENDVGRGGRFDKLTDDFENKL